MSPSAAFTVCLLLLAQTPPPPPGGDPTAATPPEVEAPAPTDTGEASFRGAFELALLSMPSGPRGGRQDLFVSGMPLLSFDAGPDFGLELGAPLRLRVFDDAPEQRSSDFNGLLRREDWDQVSDFGQILRELRIGRDGGFVHVRAGAFGGYTLGNGQLISRYSNGLNPDYHPAGGNVVAFLGPTRVELFASDVLGGRLFAGELALDLARTLGGAPELQDRFHFSLAVAHDFGRAGGTSPRLTLAWLEVDGAFIKEQRLRFSAYLGGGGRVQDDGASLGATLGVAGEGQPRGMRVGGRAEVRKQNSGFRQGMIGFDYELARFSATGLQRVPLADERLPNAFSFYGELGIALGGADAASLDEANAVFSASAEHFTWGRTNLDVSLQGRAFDGKGVLAARFAAVGLGQTPRYVTGLEARYRFLPSLYALGSGGTIFFPQPEGGLSRGAFVSLGVGADFAR